MKKQIISMLLAIFMVVGMLPTTAFAATGDNLCDHHTEHTPDCGYVEAVEGSPCTHVHDEACGYVAAVEEVLCACTETDDTGATVHTEDCGYVAGVAGSDCTHTHDELCGYVEAVAGSECTYVCEETHGEDPSEEPSDTAAAQITGVSITVDGTTYTSGNVTITPDTQSVVYTVIGSNLQNGTTDHAVIFANGLFIDMSNNYEWTFSDDGSSATISFPVAHFVLCDNFEVKYTNDGFATEIGTGSYLTYDDGTGGEEDTVPAEITGMSLSVDGTIYTEGDVTVTADSKVIMTLTGTNFANLSDNNLVWLDYNQYYMDPVSVDMGWVIDADANTATLDFTYCYGVEDAFMSNKGFELQYSNDGKTTWIGTDIRLTYDDGTDVEENTDPAEITGVSITVDGDEYSSGNVTITPETQSIIFTVTGTNFANVSADNMVSYAMGSRDSLNNGWWIIDEASNTATWDMSEYIGWFVYCDNFAVTYSNDGNTTEIPTGIYITYDDSSSDSGDSGGTTEPVTLAIGDNGFEHGKTYTYTAEQDGTLYVTVTEIYYGVNGAVIEANLNNWVAVTINGTAITAFANTLDVSAGDTVTIAVESLDGDIYYGTVSLSWDAPVSDETTEPDCTHANTTTATVEATCAADGSTTVTCDDCGETVSTDTIPASGQHSYENGSCTGCGAAAIARIGETYYPTLEAALAAAKESATEEASVTVTVRSGELIEAAFEIPRYVILSADEVIFAGEITNNGTISGGYYQGKLVNNGVFTSGTIEGPATLENSGEISGGMINRSFTNAGTISGGNFGSDVTNDGLITGGTFGVTVTNNGTIKGGTFRNGCDNYGIIENGTFPDAVRNYDTGIIKNGTFTYSSHNYDIIENGTFTCQIMNYGAINGGSYSTDGSGNFTLVVMNCDENALITGGTFNGEIEQQSGTISGGNFNGSVVSQGSITGGTFNAALINGADGTVDNSEGGIVMGESFYFTNNGTVICGENHQMENGSCILCGTGCTCETKCIEGSVNSACIVCAKDLSGCTVTGPATLTGVTITVDGIEYGLGKEAGTTAILTAATESIIYTVTGDNFAGLSENNMLLDGIFSMAVAKDSNWTIDPKTNTASYDVSRWLEDYVELTEATELKLSNDGGSNFSGTGVYMQYVCTHSYTDDSDLTCDVCGDTRVIITKQPVSVQVEIGEHALIYVEVEGNGLTYQWYYKDRNSTEFKPSVYTGTTYSMTMAEFCHERQVYCVITDQYGNTVQTETAMMSRPPQELAIVTQPHSVEVELGEKAAITVVATGEGLTYQWYYKNKNDTEFKISCFTGKSYSMTMAEWLHGREVYCVITDENGETLTTETATMTRPPIELKIIAQPQDVQVEIGEKATITAQVQGEGLTYQWYYKNKNGTEFAKSSFTGKTYAMTMAEFCHGRQVYCVITDENGETLTTEIATMTRPPIELKIVAQPQDIQVELGEKATITVQAQGEGLTYQWYYKNKNGTEFAVSSFKSKSYSMTMAEFCHMREVYCVITDMYGNQVTTDVATMTRPPQELAIVTQPESVYTEIGGSVRITVAAQGDGLSYQWYYKNAGDTGFKTSVYTGKTYSMTLATWCDGREVYCVITDQYGNAVTTQTAIMSSKQN